MKYVTKISLHVFRTNAVKKKEHHILLLEGDLDSSKIPQFFDQFKKDSDNKYKHHFLCISSTLSIQIGDL